MTDELVKRLGDTAAERERASAQEYEGNMLLVVARLSRSDAKLMLDAKARIEALTADNARLLGLLSEADQRLAWESLGFGNDFADRVEAALNTGKEASHD